ncbi:Leucine aminopeptidase A [Diplonema papillatum]|nr:Leucine aminopeptidase A [Diplonema papillatum]|eukprot:gene19614-30215_t
MQVAACLFAFAVAGNPQMRLIETAPGVQRWVNESDLPGMRGKNGVNNFIDVTATPDAHPPLKKALAYPPIGVHHDYIESVIDTFSIDGLMQTLTQLTEYQTRYYTSQTGVDAVLYLAEQYRIAAAGRTDVRVELFYHVSWPQPSIIVTVEGSGPNSSETVILGGHIDSVGSTSTGRSPGADDDGSGSATVFSVFRALMQNQFKPERTVEFHAYAAEEVGLRGSAEIAALYYSLGRTIGSMVQFDMTGYTGGSVIPSISLIDDNTNPTLNLWLQNVIDYYLTTGYTYSSCGYGCSDHASFTRNGYPAAFPFESMFGDINPYIHTANDVISHLNTTHITEFGKLGIAYVCDMACPAGIESCT